MPLTTSAAVKQLSDQNSDGTALGTGPLDLIGFYTSAVPGNAQGARAPVAQPGNFGGNAQTIGSVTIYGSTQSPTAVAANTTAEKALTVTGVLATDLVVVIKPTSQAGLAVGSSRVSAANTVQVTLGNDTAGSITPTAAETYTVLTIPAAMQFSAVLSPASVAPNSSVEQVFTVPGVVPGMTVFANKPTAQAGLIILGARVVGVNQVGIDFANYTAAAIIPTAAETYLFGAITGIQPAPVAYNLSATINPAIVAANTTAEQTFTVTGLIPGTPVIVNKPSVTPGIGIAGARVSALNTLAINFSNNTAASIDPPQEAYLITAFGTAAPAAGSATVLPGQMGGGDHGALVALGLMAGP